jgi:hypothetical protein
MPAPVSFNSRCAALRSSSRCRGEAVLFLFVDLTRSQKRPSMTGMVQNSVGSLREACNGALIAAGDIGCIAANRAMSVDGALDDHCDRIGWNRSEAHLQQLLMRAVRKHTDCPWVLRYLER